MRLKLWGPLALALAGCVLSAARPAAAAPNVWGATGLVTIPTADMMDYRELGAQVHIGPDFKTYGAQYGLYSRLEIGVSWASADKGNSLGVQHTLSTMPNAKYAIFKEGTVIPGVAVGTIDPINDTRLGPTFYAVASKTVKMPTPLNHCSFGVHGGIGSGIYDGLPFAGAELGIGWPFTWASYGMPIKLIAETADGHLNGALRLAGPLGFGGEVGVIDRDRGATFEAAFSFKKRF